MDIWKELEYFDQDKSGANTKGFKAKSIGTQIFAKIWRYLEKLKDEENSKFLLVEDPCVSENKYKMTFELLAFVEEEENEPIEGDVDPDDEEKMDSKSIKFEVRINGPNGKEDEKEKDLFVQFFRKEGNIVDFNNFYKKMMKEALYMFVEPENA